MDQTKKIRGLSNPGLTAVPVICSEGNPQETNVLTVNVQQSKFFGHASTGVLAGFTGCTVFMVTAGPCQDSFFEWPQKRDCCINLFLRGHDFFITVCLGAFQTVVDDVSHNGNIPSRALENRSSPGIRRLHITFFGTDVEVHQAIDVYLLGGNRKGCNDRFQISE